MTLHCVLHSGHTQGPGQKVKYYMRLKCPNCNAIYEVGDGVIPPEGRDVQCSNCAHTWFQYPEGHDDRPEEEAAAPIAAPKGDAVPPVNADTAAPTDDPDAGPGDASPPDTTAAEPDDDAFEASLLKALEDEPETVDAASEPPPAPEPTPAPKPTLPTNAGDVEDAVAEVMAEAEASTAPGARRQAEMPRKPLAPEVSDVLREEAERELAQRRSDGAAGLSTQPDLGIEETGAAVTGAASAARARMARKREATRQEDTEPPARRDLLPDIEEINSTLRSTNERKHDLDAPVSSDPVEERAHRSGFRIGFVLIVLLATLGFVAYAQAPRILSLYPAAEPYVTPYTQTVDGWRLALDGMIQKLTLYVKSLSA